MGAIPTNIIKKKYIDGGSNAASEGAMSDSSPRILRSQMLGVPEDGAGSVRIRSRSRVSTDNAVLAEQPFEIPAMRLVSNQIEQDEPEPIGASEPTMEEIEAMWIERVERAREQARSEGFDEGRAAAVAECEAKLDEAAQRFSENLDAVQQSWEAFLRRAEPQMVQLAFRIARAILDAPLPDDVRRISESAVVDAVERMANGAPVEIVLHPVDYLRMQESGIEEHLGAIHSKLRWRTDANLNQNEWVVQSQHAATRRLEAELIDQLQRELSVRDTQRNDGGE